jgi:hypothetical protein
MAEEPGPVESPDVGLGEMAPDGVGQRAYWQQRGPEPPPAAGTTA